MPHNGKRSQVNFWFLGGSDVFMNYFKVSSRLTFQDNSGVPAPDTYNENGYLTSVSNGGVYTTFSVPSMDYRPGNYVLGWSGGATRNRRNFTNNLVSGSNTNLSTGVWNGQNGRMVIQLTGTPTSAERLAIDIGYNAIDASSPMTDAWFVHEDDEVAYLAEKALGKEPRLAEFEERLSAFGVARFLDWQVINTSMLTLWEHVTPEGAFSYNVPWCPSGVFKGTTTNTGDDYEIAGVGAPADKDTICIKFNANASSSTVTLNGIAVLGPYGDGLFSTERPVSGRFATLVYDEELDCWLKTGGDSSGLNVTGVQGGVPISICLDICRDLGIHPWFHAPYLALDPPTDFVTELATACKAYVEANATWMVPRFEPANEVWNSAAGFYATRYGWNKEQARGQSDFRSNEWYGRVLAVLGEAVHDVYSPTGAKSSWPYQVICGVQTHSTPASSNARLTTDDAEDWATHVACANYFGPTLSATAELQLAWDYNQDPTDEPEQLVASLSAATAFGVPYVASIISGWKTWADGFGLGLTFYEGGYSPDYRSSNDTGTISGASKAAQCVLTIATSTKPPVGSDLSIASVVGMTELNGNTYEVVAVNGNSVTIDVDSTGFTNYTSGGTATYVNSMTMRNALRAASKNEATLYDFMRHMDTVCLFFGEYPARYLLAGASAAWPILDPHIYITDDPPQWDAVEALDATDTPLTLSLRLAS
jgi:hypothetical protein